MLGLHVIGEHVTETVYRECVGGIDYSPIPEPYRHTIRSYVERGLPPGAAMRAFLEGKILAMLDFEDEKALKGMVVWAHNKLPDQIWGSPAKVRRWLKRAPAMARRTRRSSARCSAPACRSAYSAVAL